MTGLLLSERFLDHRAPAGHPERGERLIAVGRALHDAGLITPARAFAPRAASDAEIGRVHRADWVAGMAARLPGQGGRLDADTYFAPASWQVAREAAGGVIDLALAVRAGEVGNGAAFVRPPGHHAEPARAMGFCLLNNVALAAAAARAAGAARVAIVDWDVHHGNGTQRAFWDDPTVLYVSLHQHPLYPGTGAADELGGAAARGATINLPLPAGMGDAEYLHAFDALILPALARHAPELILVSAGFDAHARDPLGGMALTEEGYRQMTLRLLRLAGERCGGRLVAVLEGGYDLVALSRSAAAMVEALERPDRAPAPSPGAPAPAAAAVVAEVARRLAAAA